MYYDRTARSVSAGGGHGAAGGGGGRPLPARTRIARAARSARVALLCARLRQQAQGLQVTSITYIAR